MEGQGYACERHYTDKDFLCVLIRLHLSIHLSEGQVKNSPTEFVLPDFPNSSLFFPYFCTGVPCPFAGYTPDLINRYRPTQKM